METRTQRIRRCRKIAKRLGLNGMAKRIEAAGSFLRYQSRESSDAMLRVIVADMAWMRHYFDVKTDVQFKQAAE